MSFRAVGHLDVAPFIQLESDQSADGQLRISCAPHLSWLVGSLREDLSRTAGLASPWLPRIHTGTEPSAVFALPWERGVTLRALWPTLSLEERAWVTVALLKTLLRAGPVTLFPRSGVLCDSEGLLWLVPPFRECAEGASKTWDQWQFDEYGIGGLRPEMPQTLTFTLTRLLLESSLPQLLSLRTERPPLPSEKVAWLAPLDPLVMETWASLLDKRPTADDLTERWAATLAVMEDQHQASAPSLATLVARAWPVTDLLARWSWG